MQSNNPEKLYHGTPYDIHLSDAPYLDPARRKPYANTGDPEGPSIFATRSLKMARTFAFRDQNCRTCIHTSAGTAMVYDGQPTIYKGNVFEVPSDGFKEIQQNGRSTDLWYLRQQDIPGMLLSRGATSQRGIAIYEPIERPVLPELIEAGLRAESSEARFRVFLLTGRIALSDYQRASREATHRQVWPEFISRMADQDVVQDISSELVAIYDAMSKTERDT